MSIETLAVVPAVVLAVLLAANAALLAARLLHRDDAARRIAGGLGWSARWLGLGRGGRPA